MKYLIALINMSHDKKIGECYFKYMSVLLKSQAD